MADLPQELLHLVFRELVELEGIEQAAKMRLVSKAWLAACADYPAEVFCKYQDLQTLCKILPCMSSLKLQEEGKWDLQLLQSCTHLTSVELYQFSHSGSCKRSDYSDALHVDLSYLPPGVSNMTFYLTILSESISAISLPQLTKLHCRFIDNKPQDIWNFLGSLTQLQVSISAIYACCHFLHALLHQYCWLSRDYY